LSARRADTRAISRPLNRAAGGAVRMLGSALSALASMFEGLFAAPKPPPTPAQQKEKAARAEARDRLAEFREFVAEREQSLFTTNQRIHSDERERNARDEESARRSREGPGLER
jgi:hypothetical protein